jgi:PAS domain S-box-containing protein
VTDLSSYAFSTLREGELSLYRGSGDGMDPILLVAPVAEHPPLEVLKRLEHEYALRAELDPDWAARPLALTRRHNRTTLVLEDPGGEPLDRLLGRALETTQFLRIAIPLTAALRQVHERNLIHKDIKPANVLVDMASGEAWLTGFGIASRLPREHQVPEPPEVIAGTLAYMAPEQTGRMNRSIDSRSDLYALGVTLYEMSTGALPFTAADPMAWVHCHIARQPVPPSERATAVPAQISSIVMKLLAKTGEDRYQTAAGVEADLRRCLAAWESSGRIERFPLGTQDASDRLMIPERLYGREPEIGTLLVAFDRVVAHGRTELVLVSGYSGIGKSSVVHELHKSLVPPRGLFASGKFDQYKRDIPYATLARAFQTLVRQILGKTDVEVGRWRDDIREAIGPNGQLIVNLIPELELIIGKQPPVTDLAPQDSQSRFQLVFRRFLAVFARPEHPLALFLDDLQWLDAATLELLEDLATQPDVRHLMLVGAYRDNEVSSSHPLMRRLDAIRKAGASVQEIVLAPLTRNDLDQLIADSLHCEPERASPLAQLVQEKTAGNPFFAIQFVTALAEEGLLTFDPGAAAWSWDLRRIRAKGYTDNVVDLMVGKLNRLPDKSQEALKQLACLGNSAEVATLTWVHGASKEEMQAALWEAVRAGLVLRSDNTYAFLHDRVQEAAYSLIPESERGAAHIRIGRLLASRTVPEGIEEKIFEIVNQFNRGVDLITSAAERDRAADLNLIAGRRAKTSTAYASALTYLAAGCALLREDCWDQRYELTFALEFHRAECELLTGDLAAAEERLSKLSCRARNLVDIAAVACLRLTLYTTLDRSDRGVEVCLEYLQRGGVHWSPHPTKDEVREEYERILLQLGSRSIEELVDLPLMSDPVCRATIDVLTEVVTPALFTDENLLSLVICRMANLSLEHGNSDGSCFAYVWLGMILGPHFGDYQAGFRFGRLGYDLVDKRGLHRFQARAYMSFGNLVIPWSRHIQTGRNLVRLAFDAANKIGDLTFAAYACNNLNTNLLATGDPLGDVQREAENGLDFARKARFGLVIDIITAQLGLIRTLRGLTPQFGSFNDEQFDESRFEHHLQSDPRLALPECWYWIRKLQARFFAGEYSFAVEASSKAQRLLWTSPSFFEVAEYHFYGALARAACCDTTLRNERSQHLEALLAHYEQLALWAENCPENFASRAAMVAAEIARAEGRELDAERLYEEAIRLAREQGFIQNEGIANELAARFHAVRGLETAAHAYLRNARYCYLRWGAEGKMRQLEKSHPHLREEPAPSPPTATFGAPIEQLDVGTVVKASQALSGEIVLGRLIETLMTIALEHAGAERGMLILLRSDEPQVEAEASVGRQTVEVTLRQVAVTLAELPESLLHTVIRTHQSVILDDAQRSNPFTEDEYLQRRRPRSVLCLPLVKQAELIGLLYLENNLAPGTFTPRRIAVLELLASQAAISLENARLYADLISENRDRQKAEDALRRSEASLTEAQQISHTGSWRWKVGTGEVSGSAEHFRIFGFDPATSQPSYATFMERIHAEDRPSFERALGRAVRERSRFQHEYRIALRDGSVRHLQSVGQPDIAVSGELEFVGTVMDITERRRGEEALRNAQAELARVARLTTMGELVASLAHEINQPLAAVVTNGSACLRWLNRDEPDLAEARDSVSRIVRDAERAGDVIRGLRALAKKSGPQMSKLDINDAIQEVLALTRSELQRHRVVLHTHLFVDDRPVFGDRVQLQQVLLNLIMNGVEAMSAVTDRPKVLAITSEPVEPGGVLVAVEDAGTGLDPETADRIFDPFFTTKPNGMGMGLSICRSIIEAHGGRFWASRRAPQGTAFRFTVPAAAEISADVQHGLKSQDASDV